MRPVVFWNPGVAARIQRKFGGWRNSRTWRLSRHFFSWSILRAHTQETVRSCVKTVFKLISPKTEIARSVRGLKIRRVPCRRRNGGAVLRAEHFGDLTTADHKVLSDNCESRNNHRSAVVVQNLAAQWIQAYPCKNKNFTRNPEKLAKVFGTREEAKSHLHWQFLQILWRSLLESLHVYTTQIRNKWDCRKCSAQSKGKHFCCIVAIKSEWKLVGRFYGMLCLSAKRHRSIIWWEDALWKTFWATFLKDRLFHLAHWLSISLWLRRIQSKIHQLGKKVLLGLFFGYALYADVNLKGWRTGRRPCEVGNDGRIWNLLNKTQCERGDISLRKRRIYFSNRRWTNQNPWRRSRPENIPPWYGSDQSEEKVTLIFLENQKGLFHHFTTHFRMPVKRFLIFGPCQETSHTAITLNPESNFTCGDKRENSRHPGQIIYGQKSGKQWESTPKLKEKQKWSNEKLHLENARKLRGIYFIDPEGKGSQRNHQESS